MVTAYKDEGYNALILWIRGRLCWEGLGFGVIVWGPILIHRMEVSVLNWSDLIPNGLFHSRNILVRGHITLSQSSGGELGMQE